MSSEESEATRSRKGPLVHASKITQSQDAKCEASHPIASFFASWLRVILDACNHSYLAYKLVLAVYSMRQRRSIVYIIIIVGVGAIGDDDNDTQGVVFTMRFG